MNQFDEEDCKRHRHYINRKNFYIVKGQTFIFCKFAYDNQVQFAEMRDIIDTICDSATESLEEKQLEIDSLKLIIENMRIENA